MASWSVSFDKAEELTNDQYLEEFLNQAESKITGLTLLDTPIDRFCSQSEIWGDYKNHYTSGKFIYSVAEMDIDALCNIHNNSSHHMSGAYEPTSEAVYELYTGESTDRFPVIPFVLDPETYTYLEQGTQETVTYTITKQGRSRLAGVRNAREDGVYNKDTVPVLFAIRRTRK